MTEYSFLRPTVFNTAKDPHVLYAEESEEPEVTLEQKMMGYNRSANGPTSIANSMLLLLNCFIKLSSE